MTAARLHTIQKTRGATAKLLPPKTKIMELSVKVTYTVHLSEEDIPEEVLSELQSAVKNNLGEISDSDSQYPKATEWLDNNIHEDDATRWEYDIQELKI